MRALAFGLVLALCGVFAPPPAYAQVVYSVVVSSCGTVTYPAAGKTVPRYVDTSGNPCGSSTTGLPAGAATSAKQDTGNTSLGTIATNTTGAATAANQTSVQAPVAPATATATKSALAACQYNSAGVTATDGQQLSLQCGSKGGLSVAGAVASGAADAGNPIKTGGIYNSSPITVTNGQRADTQTDSHGSAKTVATDTAGNVIDSTQPVQTYESNSFVDVPTGTATTVIKSGAGTLVRLCINTKGASSNTLTLYDNTAGSGTKIAVIDTTTAVGCLTYGLAFGTGLTAVSATGTGADYTSVYR